MSAKKVGPLIKDARTKAGFTQSELASKIPSLTAPDISKAERGEKMLTQEELKMIAKLTGVTQKSLLEAAGYGKGTTSSSTSSSSSANTTSMKLTATEKKLVELYRAATSEKKKEAMKVLKGEGTDTEEIISNILGTAVEMLMKK
ncbi:MAG: helix-turn-helix domain-containing protein [Lachnospiraceae bacterium]|nr:helix-turn-helix domain-containing protein [Lachnospiraceae bacterium]